MLPEISDEYPRGFHFRAGLVFQRRADGAVRITKNGHPVAVIDADSWPSIVAAMSVTGETTESYYAAREQHAHGYTLTDEQKRRLGVALSAS